MVRTMNDIIKYDLISNIISFIYSLDYVATAVNLAKDCSVPLPFMRTTLYTLLSNQTIRECLDIYSNSDSTSLIEDFLESPCNVKDAFLNGNYDNYIWELNLNILNINENAILPLSHIEYGALKSFGQDILSVKKTSLFEKKETINPISDKVRKIQTTLINAKENHQKVYFDYKNSKGITEKVYCFPVDIVTNVTDNWIYMWTTDGNSYRLDRILHNVTIIKDASEYPHYSIPTNRKYAWGSFFKDDDIPIHVKLQISANTGNIISKIQDDIRFRKDLDSYKFYPKENYYYYEDDVIGLDEFQRWIRGYGSSIIVIEPDFLKDSIIKRANETLLLYEKSKKWGEL